MGAIRLSHKSRPDVALYLPTLAGGGAERVVLDLCGAFVSLGLTIDLVVASWTGELKDSVPEGVRLVDLGSGRAHRSVVPLVKYLARSRPRALMSTLEHANLVAILAAKLVPRTRVVIREANSASRDIDTSSRAGRFMRLLARLLYPRADAIVAVSKGVADDLRDHIGISPTQIQVIGNPVLTERIRLLAQAEVHDPWLNAPSTPLILAVGRLTRQKGFDVLLHAFANLRQHRRCRLMILGEGELREQLLELASSLGVAQHVRMPGYAANPFPYIAGARVFALSSRWEGLPNVLIQAMALGTTVVATDCVSGPSEILDGGRLGTLVPVDDPAAMYKALEEALDQPSIEVSEEWKDRYRVESVARAYAALLVGEERVRHSTSTAA